MQYLAFQRGLKYGDITLVGSDGVAIKAFSNILMLSPYFEASQSFSEAAQKTYNFDSFNSEQLIRMVKYLHGILPLKFNKHVMDLLDYFQIPFDSVTLSADVIHDITIDQIMRVFDKRAMNIEQFYAICDKIFKEGHFYDAEVMKWIEKQRKDYRFQVSYYSEYRTIFIAHCLIEKNYEEVDAGYNGYERGDIIKDLMILHANSQMNPKYLAKYLIHLMNQYRSQRTIALSDNSGPEFERAIYINGILKDQGETECDPGDIVLGAETI